MIRKIIGFILVLIIVFFAIKAVVFLPFFADLVIGNNKTPFQIGNSYIEQINKIYPYKNYNQLYSTQIKYNQNINSGNHILDKVTLEKIEGKLILSIENLKPINAELNIWLTNSPEITDRTTYIDFGPVYKKGDSFRQYFFDLKGYDISLDEFNNILLVDKNYKIFNKIILK